MRIYFCYLACCLSLSLYSQQVIITGIIDGTSGGSPRAVELYVSGTLDLAGYTLDRYANAATTPNDRTNLSGVWTDEFVYVINADHDAAFTSAFGTDGDFANRISGTNLFGNGNDAFTVALGATIVDQTGGEIGNTDNVYADSYLYRLNNTGPDGGWVAANWTIPGNDVLDGLSFAEMGSLVPFGTYTPAPAGPSVIISATTDAEEPAVPGDFTLTVSESPTTDLTVTYSLSGTATPGEDYTDVNNGSVTIFPGETSAFVVLEPIDDNASEPTETITITLVAVSDASFSLGGPATLLLFDDEPVTATPIHAVQGASDQSPLLGQSVTVEGIVVGAFQGGEGIGLNGFFLQEEDIDADADQTTSEGIWIYDENGGVGVGPGDRVMVTGTVREVDGLTQIDATGSQQSIMITGREQALPTATTLALPLSTPGELEWIEGMRTTVVNEVTVTDLFGLARFGEFIVSVGGRLAQFTECNAPDPAALAAYRQDQVRRQLRVDDGRDGDNNYPIFIGDDREVSPTRSFRAGTVLRELTGVMDERFSGYRLQATGFTEVSGNERPTAAPDLGGNLTVVGMNVLNYFTTLGSRGADDADEFTRQESKIVNAICALDADIIGLAEIENNGYGPDGALQSLIDAIREECGLEYAFVRAPETGTDQIQVALIYKTEVVEESGTAASLSTPAALFNANRVPVAQTFRIIEAGNSGLGQELTVCVNHWKSKGGSCGTGDDDDGGAGSCNGTRTAAAIAIRDWLATNPTGTMDPDRLIIGDLNAYTEETPITTLTDAGYVNAIRAQNDPESFPCGGVPSFVFRSEWGSLDHALASASLADQISGATAWAVNAEEPSALDYDTRFNDPALYADDFYRFSDHNPIVVGLELERSVSTTTAVMADVRVTNITNGIFRLEGAPAGSGYQLVDARGAILLSGSTAGAVTDINATAYPAGVYFLSVRSPNGAGRSFKLPLR